MENKNVLTIVCRLCKKEFETPKKLEGDEEHPLYCQECPIIE